LAQADCIHQLGLLRAATPTAEIFAAFESEVGWRPRDRFPPLPAVRRARSPAGVGVAPYLPECSICVSLTVRASKCCAD